MIEATGARNEPRRLHIRVRMQDVHLEGVMLSKGLNGWVCLGRDTVPKCRNAEKRRLVQAPSCGTRHEHKHNHNTRFIKRLGRPLYGRNARINVMPSRRSMPSRTTAYSDHIWKQMPTWLQISRGLPFARDARLSECFPKTTGKC